MKCETCDRECQSDETWNCQYCCSSCGEDIPEGTGEKVIFWYCASCYQSQLDQIGRQYDELKANADNTKGTT